MLDGPPHAQPLSFWWSRRARPAARLTEWSVWAACQRRLYRRSRAHLLPFILFFPQMKHIQPRRRIVTDDLGRCGPVNHVKLRMCVMFQNSGGSIYNRQTRTLVVGYWVLFCFFYCFMPFSMKSLIKCPKLDVTELLFALTRSPKNFMQPQQIINPPKWSLLIVLTCCDKADRRT